MNQTLDDGLSTARPRQIRLKPANDNGAKSYTGSADNRILFLIGSYPNSWLNNGRSFIEFKAKCTSTDGTEANTIRFKDGMPLFERIVVRSGSKLLCDVRDADTLDILLQNFYDKDHLAKVADQIGNYKALEQEGASAADPIRGVIAYKQRQGRVFRKPLNGVGIFDPATFVPIGLLGSASNAPALEVEIFLKPASDVLENENGTALSAPGDASYSLSEVRYNLELYTLPEASYNALNQRLYSGGSYQFDFPMYRSYRNYVNGSTKYDIDIHNSVRNLDEVMVALRESGGSYPYRFVGSGKRRTGVLNGTSLGAQDDEQVVSYMFRLGAEYYPSERLDTTDEKAALFQALRTKDMLYSDKVPFLAVTNHNGRSHWETGGCFSITQGFKSSAGSAKLGLATQSIGVPLQLELEFGASTNALDVLVYTKETFSLRISLAGNVEVVEA